MKNLKCNTLLFVLLLVLTTCAEEDFKAPNSYISNPVLEGNAIITTITQVAGKLSQEQSNNDNLYGPQPLNYSNENDTFTYSSEDFPNPIYMVGYVVSSDESGNFFEEIILQDNFKNPSIGIKILVDVNPLFTRYDIGRKVYIRLNNPQGTNATPYSVPYNLSVGITNGVLTLGVINGNKVDKISSTRELEVIFRTSDKQNIVPLPITIGEFSEDKTNLFVHLNNVQFSASETVNSIKAVSYASEPDDNFDGERTLESCDSGASTVFSTSTFADFSAALMPSGSGTVNGILTRNFFGDTFNVIVNSPENIDFNHSNRCDPFFLEDFQSVIDGEQINLTDWINYNQQGSRLWVGDVFSGNGVARFTSFSSGDTSNTGWLILPPMDMDVYEGEVLNFKMQHAYPDAEHDPIELLYSTNFNGITASIGTATWTSLPFTKSYIEDSSNWFSFVNSGDIDLSSITGKIYIAFRYTGSDTYNQNMTIDIDDIKVVVL